MYLVNPFITMSRNCQTTSILQLEIFKENKEFRSDYQYLEKPPKCSYSHYNQNDPNIFLPNTLRNKEIHILLL